MDRLFGGWLMSTDTFEYLLDDLLNYCLEIEQLKASLCGYYKLLISFDEPDYEKKFREQHGFLLELDEALLLTKQASLKSLYSNYKLCLSVNRKLNLIERIEEALKEVDF